MIKRAFIVFILLFIFAATVFMSVNTKSPICDEAGHHIAAGYSYIKTHDFRITPSPPLIRLLIGLPILFLNPALPLDHISWKNADSSGFNYQFLFVYNHNADQIVLFSRLLMIVVAVILGLLIFAWSNKLYGYRAGIFALFLYVFSPIVLGNAGLAMLDLGCAAFIFASLFQLYRYLEHRTTAGLILTGIVFGLAQATKITALILYPLFVIFMAVSYLLNRADKKVPLLILIKDLVVIWVVGLLVLWATYFFEFKPLLKNEPHVQEKIEFIKKITHSQRLALAAENVPIPLSTYINSIFGFGRQIVLGDQPLFFMGQSVTAGSKIYYFVLCLIRTPLAFLIFLASAIVLFKRCKRAGPLDELFLIIPIISLFTAVSFSKLQGGMRYLLPAYPFVFVWASRLVTVSEGRSVAATRAVFYVLCTWYFLSSSAIYPDYLAYYNELVGGPDSGAYKISSDADWGQDFKALKKYMDSHDLKEVKLLCFGAVDPAYYGIKYEDLTKEEYIKPVEGKCYAVSSRFMPLVKWADAYRPEDIVAHNIRIYCIKGK